MFYSTIYKSPVGLITLACDEDALVGLWLEGQKYYGKGVAVMTERDDIPVFGRVKDWLTRYFAGERPDAAELKLSPMGSGFRQGVWALLREIPYGEVTTYGDIANRIAERMGRGRMSAQAVGGAVGHNPISIIIPCHRVVGVGGSLTGYAGGIGVKKTLLALEGVDMSALFVPHSGTAL